jgi:ubiquinone/menaquinone biosynthesis C-methylase UbiE/uncharacterized protein YbaR (Trm112 family)
MYGGLQREERFVCPLCREALTAVSTYALRCDFDKIVFQQRDGIWQFLTPDAESGYAQFIKEYETVRQNEGRISDNPNYYRALPFADLTENRTAEWQIRTQSFMTLVQKVIDPMAKQETINNQQPTAHHSSPVLYILDLGAGNCWMSNRLAEQGHEVTAVDLTINPFDGLGAHKQYKTRFSCVQAEFDRLPFVGNQVDLVIFNASFHYAVNYDRTLTEAWRVLRPGGSVVIVDTAVYHNPTSGQQMVQERERQFQQTYGFASNTILSENYLSYQRLDNLANAKQINWQFYWPLPRWRWAVRRLRARLRGQREPGQFPLIVGQRRSEQ